MRHLNNRAVRGPDACGDTSAVEALLSHGTGRFKVQRVRIDNKFMNILMIQKDRSYPTGRRISRENSGEVDDVYVRNLALASAVIRSGRRFSFVCWRGFFLFCFLWGRLAWFGPFFPPFFLMILETGLPSSAFFRKYFKTNCFISM